MKIVTESSIVTSEIVLPVGYIEAVRERYLKGIRKEKGQILEEVIQPTGYHRDAGIRAVQ